MMMVDPKIVTKVDTAVRSTQKRNSKVWSVHHQAKVRPPLPTELHALMSEADGLIVSFFH